MPPLDNRIANVLKLMQQMPDYKRNQIVRIIDVLAELPSPEQASEADDRHQPVP